MARKKKIILIIAASIISAILVLFITAMVIHPVAIVKYSIISNQEWQNKITQYEKAQSFYLDENNVNMASLDLPSADIIKEQALEDLIKSKIILQLARKNKINATSEEIDAAYHDLVLSQVKNGEETAEKSLEQIYGLSIEEFKEQVIKEYVLRGKLNDTLAGDIKPLAMEKAKEVFDKANANPEQFEELARMYSEDSLALKGGDIGYLGRGEMISSYENSVWQLFIGQISDLIEAPAGFYIIKMEDKQKIDGEEQVKLRQIFIKNDLDKLIDKNLSSYNIIRLVK